MSISVIIVNFESRDVLFNCLHSINLFLKNKISEIVIFNNDKKDLFINLDSPTFSIKVINNGKNIGFGSACNKAVKKTTGDLLFFLNPDTEFIDDSIMEAFTLLKKDKRIGAIGLKLLESNRDRAHPWTCGKKTSLLKILFKNTINKPWNKKEITLVDWVSAAALLVRKDIFEKINGFDEKFFMYFEDQDLCLRLKEIGKSNYFFPKSKIVHLDGRSWKDETLKKKAYYQSQNYFFKKYYGSFQLSILRKIRFFVS